jgi:hypothetical protein
MTPRQLNVIIRDYSRKEKEKTKDLVRIAWYTEALHRQKKLPKLENLLKEDKPKRVMTTEEMLEQVKKLNSIFGGEIK